MQMANLFRREWVAGVSRTRTINLWNGNLNWKMNEKKNLRVVHIISNLSRHPLLSYIVCTVTAQFSLVVLVADAATVDAIVLDTVYEIILLMVNSSLFTVLPIQCRAVVVASIVLLLLINGAVYILKLTIQRERTKARGQAKRRTIWHHHCVRILKMIAQFKFPNTLNQSTQCRSFFCKMKCSLANVQALTCRMPTWLLHQRKRTKIIPATTTIRDVWIQQNNESKYLFMNFSLEKLPIRSSFQL